MSDRPRRLPVGLAPAGSVMVLSTRSKREPGATAARVTNAIEPRPVREVPFAHLLLLWVTALLGMEMWSAAGRRAVLPWQNATLWSVQSLMTC
jgi:hypothetical protein